MAPRLSIAAFPDDLQTLDWSNRARDAAVEEGAERRRGVDRVQQRAVERGRVRGVLDVHRREHVSIG